MTPEYMQELIDKREPYRVFITREEHEAFMEFKGWKEENREKNRKSFDGSMSFDGGAIFYEPIEE